MNKSEVMDFERSPEEWRAFRLAMYAKEIKVNDTEQERGDNW
jgi:hypothetical protein